MNELATLSFFALLREAPHNESPTAGIEAWQSAYADLHTHTLQLSDSTPLTDTFRSLHALRMELVSIAEIDLSHPGKKCA